MRGIAHSLFEAEFFEPGLRPACKGIHNSQKGATPMIAAGLATIVRFRLTVNTTASTLELAEGRSR